MSTSNSNTLVKDLIGFDPDQIPTNAMLGGLAFQDSAAPQVGTAALGDNSGTVATTAFVQATTGGVLVKSVAGGSTVTLTAIEAGNGTLVFTGVLTANISVIVPVAPTAHWQIDNNTTGAFTLTVKTPAGTGVVVAQGYNSAIFSDGTNVQLSQTDYTSPVLTGTPTAPTPASGTNTTQVGTAALIQQAVGGYLNKSVAGGATVTLSAVEAGNAVINLTGAITANIAVVVPIAYTSRWIFANNTTGAFTVTIKTAAGTGQVLEQTQISEYYTDGTNALVAKSSTLTQALFDATTKLASTAFVYSTQADTQGAFTNLKIVSIGVNNFISTVTADSITMRNPTTGQYYTSRSVSNTANISTTGVTAGVGGLDTGTLAASTWYYIFAIFNPTTLATATLFSISNTAPTLPSGFTFFARVGAVVTDSSVNKYLMQLVQIGTVVQYAGLASSNTLKPPLVAVNAASGTAISLSATVPATAMAVIASITGNPSVGVTSYNASLGGNQYVVINQAQSSPIHMNFGTGTASAYSAFTQSARIVLESLNLYASGGNNNVYVQGWEDNL